MTTSIPKSKFLSDKNRLRLIYRLRAGERPNKIADAYKISERRVRQIAKDAGLRLQKVYLPVYLHTDKKFSPWCTVAGTHVCVECDHSQDQHWKHGCVAQYMTRERCVMVMKTCPCIVTRHGGRDRRSCQDCVNFDGSRMTPICKKDLPIYKGAALECAEFDDARDGKIGRG